MFTNSNIFHQWRTMAVTLVSMIVYCITVSHTVQAVILSGVTIESHPFLMTQNNRFSGLCVDVLNEIQYRTGLNYSLYLVSDKRYGPGRMTNGKVKGLIGDVYHKKADFAIADMTVTTLRQQYVTFSKPFFTFSISALLHRNYSTNIRSLEDLADRSNVSIGAIRNGNTLINMLPSRTDNRVVRWLYDRILRNESNTVQTQAEALRKIRTEPYAFVQEEPRNAYYAKQDCDLVHLIDIHDSYVSGEYAIAFRPDSPYIKVFNAVLEKMESDGFLARLKKNYFHNQCGSTGRATRSVINSNVLFAHLVVALAFSGAFFSQL